MVLITSSDYFPTVINRLVFVMEAVFYKAGNESLHIKGKAIPLQAWRGPEVSRRLRLPDFKTIGI